MGCHAGDLLPEIFVLCGCFGFLCQHPFSLSVGGNCFEDVSTRLFGSSVSGVISTTRVGKICECEY